MCQQPVAGTGGHEHAHAAPAFADAKVDQRVVGTGDGQRVHGQVGGAAAHGRESLAFLGVLFQDHFGNPLPDLDKDRLGFVKVDHLTRVLLCWVCNTVKL